MSRRCCRRDVPRGLGRLGHRKRDQFARLAGFGHDPVADYPRPAFAVACTSAYHPRIPRFCSSARTRNFNHAGNIALMDFGEGGGRSE